MSLYRHGGLALISVLFCLLIISASLTAMFDVLALEKNLARYYKNSWATFHQAELALMECERRLLNMPLHKLIVNYDLVNFYRSEETIFYEVNSKGTFLIADKSSGLEAGCLISVSKTDIENSYQSFSGGAVSASIYAYAHKKSDIEKETKKSLIKADYYLR